MPWVAAPQKEHGDCELLPPDDSQVVSTAVEERAIGVVDLRGHMRRGQRQLP